jgi:Fe-S cluster biosynthesis and repair protein YggX
LREHGGYQSKLGGEKILKTEYTTYYITGGYAETIAKEKRGTEEQIRAAKEVDRLDYLYSRRTLQRPSISQINDAYHEWIRLQKQKINDNTVTAALLQLMRLVSQYMHSYLDEVTELELYDSPFVQHLSFED